MDALIEILLEIFGELIIEVLCGVIGSALESIFYNYTFSEERKKRMIRYIVYGLYSLALVILLVFCIIYGKTIFTIATAIFILVNTIFAMLAKTMAKCNKYNKAIIARVLQILGKCAYCITIYIKCNTIQNTTGRVLLIVFTSIGLICGLIIDSYRIKSLLSQKHNYLNSIE